MKIKYVFVGCFGIVCAASIYFIVQHFKKPFSTAEALNVVNLLNNKDWEKRSEGIMLLARHPAILEDEKAKESFIKLFNREIEVNEKLEETDQSDPQSEQYGNEAVGEYYIELLWVASNLRDERVIPGLVYSIDLGRAPLESVVSFGEEAVNPVINLFLQSKNYLKRAACLEALALIYHQKGISSSAREKIKHSLQAGLKDKEEYVQKIAAESLKSIK